MAVAAVLKCMFSRPSSPVYLVDFAVHKGLDEWKFSKDLFIPMSAQTGVSGFPASANAPAAQHEVVMTLQCCICAYSCTQQRQLQTCASAAMYTSSKCLQELCRSCKAVSVVVASNNEASSCLLLQRFTDEELDFQKKILYRSGLGDETYVPPCELLPACSDAFLQALAAQPVMQWLQVRAYLALMCG